MGIERKKKGILKDVRGHRDCDEEKGSVTYAAQYLE